MRLSDWRATERGARVMTDKVADAYGPTLALLGAEADPISYLIWGDDHQVRYLILAVADAGLIMSNVRVNVPQEGPRASAKLVRWGRLSVGELAVEAHHGRRQVTTQIEGIVLQGVDEEADEIGAFVSELLARIDGRSTAPAGAERPERARRGSAAKSNARSTAARTTIELPATTDG